MKPMNVAEFKDKYQSTKFFFKGKHKGTLYYEGQQDNDVIKIDVVMDSYSLYDWDISIDNGEWIGNLADGFINEDFYVTINGDDNVVV